MPYKPSEVEAMIQGKLGFTKVEHSGEDHKRYELKLEGLPRIFTKISHYRQPMSSQLEATIGHQLRVRPKFFQGLMSCTIKREAYVQSVRTDPYPPFQDYELKRTDKK